MNFDKNKETKKAEIDDIEAVKSFAELLSNINLIKDKKNGCPWQNSQTHKTLIPYLFEESYELISAIQKNDKENMREELGDILMQVLLHGKIEQEENSFTIKDVIFDLNKKIKSRNPHIFETREKVTIQEAQEIWKNIKRKESSKTINTNNFANLSSDLQDLTPSQQAQGINIRAQKYGFKWANHNEILEKLLEETSELREAINRKNIENIEEEIGDIFFTLYSLSFFLSINPEKALRYANKKIIQRFITIENILGDRIHEQNIQGFKELWKIAKEQLKQSYKDSNE